LGRESVNVVLPTLSPNSGQFRLKEDVCHLDACGRDDLDGFEQILRERGALVASLQASGGFEAGQSRNSDAVAFADVALLQAGVDVVSQAVGYDGEAQPMGAGTITAGTDSGGAKLPPLDVPANCFAIADSSTPASSPAQTFADPANSIPIRRSLGLSSMTAQLRAVLSPDQAAGTSQLGASAGASQTGVGTACDVAESRPPGTSRTFQRPVSSLPVVVSLSAETGETALVVRAEGMSEADQSEFERRTREELALAGLQLRQLRINGRERPAAGVA
jgi:hypothetical protein